MPAVSLLGFHMWMVILHVSVFLTETYPMTTMSMTYVEFLETERA